MLIELIWWVRAWLTHSHHWQKPVQCKRAWESAHSTQEEGKLVHIELAHLAGLLTVRKSISDVPLYYCCYCLFQMFRTFFKFVCFLFFELTHVTLVSGVHHSDPMVLLCSAVLPTGVATICHHTTWFWYSWLYSRCCTFRPHDLLIPELDACTSLSPSPMLLFCFLPPPLATTSMFSVFTSLICAFLFRNLLFKKKKA